MSLNYVKEVRVLISEQRLGGLFRICRIQRTFPYYSRPREHIWGCNCQLILRQYLGILKTNRIPYGYRCAAYALLFPAVRRSE